jgi:hypothetical protein
LAGQGVVHTFVYVQPMEDEMNQGGSSSQSSSDDITMTCLIWLDAQMPDRYPWLDDEPCVEATLVKNPDDSEAAFTALATPAALMDARLNPTVEKDMLFNMDSNSAMMPDLCMPLVDAANLLIVEPSLAPVVRILLDRAVVAYKEAQEASGGGCPLQHPSPRPLFHPPH